MTADASNFEFVSVEDFFQNGDYQDWAKLGKVLDYDLKQTDKLVLKLHNNENTMCTILLHFPSPTTFRFRFNPAAEDSSFYPQGHSRAIVGDSENNPSFGLDSAQLELYEEGNFLNILVKNNVSNEQTMKVVINREIYSLSVFKPQADGSWLKVHADADYSIYYKKRLCYLSDNENTVQYSIIQAKQMPNTAKYVGFGEKGGYELIRNGARLTYFNYDNMRYEQIYHNGPLDIREPLYDSNPFFIELNRYPDQHSCYGIFLNNTSESFMDLGSYNHNREYLFGTMYGSMDYYFFMARKSADVLKSYCSFVGTTRLKPRFVLGNHQGCYGYENLYDLQDAVNGYRGNQIPLDGLHVDVDIQQNYSTFSMDEAKFPSDTFDQLAARGIKCSTNITPVISYTNIDYKTYTSGRKNNCFVTDQKVGQDADGREVNHSSSDGFYAGGVYYGGDRGTFGHYPDFGRMETRKWWGQQYRLLYARGLEMVWQDMTTPAIPDPHDNWDVKLKAPRYGEWWKIGDKITSSSRSFPFAILVTDNSLKKYQGEVAESTQSGMVADKSPAAVVRNLYSYNLHKATYHGLNHLWYINNYTFSILGEDGLHSDDSMLIVEALEAKKILTPINPKLKTYAVSHEFNYDDPQIELGLPAQFNSYHEDILSILKQSIQIEQRRNNKRNFIIGRGGFTGMHRFAGLWTGDNASSWDFFRINISQVLALGLAGQSMSGQDIGGFEKEQNWQQWVDPELFIRWLCAGAFLPWFRNHYIRKGQKLFQEPYKFQDYKDQAPESEQIFYQAVLPVSQYYIQLRYRLMQLFYDAMFQNTLDGVPITRPLFVNDDHDHALFNGKEQFLNNQFFVAKDLLIAPVLEKENWGRNGWREVYLPVDNKWYAFKNNLQSLDDPVSGGKEISYDAHINADIQHVPFILPIYVREGAIIPSLEIEQYVGERNLKGENNPLTINIYPGYKNAYNLYQDDGVSRSSAPAKPLNEGGDPQAKGEYRKTIIRQFEANEQKIVEFKWTHNNYLPYEKFCFIALLHDPSERYDPIAEIHLESLNFKVNAQLMFRKIEGNNDQEKADTLWSSPDNAWYYHQGLHISFIKMYFNPELDNLNPEQLSIIDDIPESQAPMIQIKTNKRGIN